MLISLRQSIYYKKILNIIKTTVNSEHSYYTTDLNDNINKIIRYILSTKQEKKIEEIIDFIISNCKQNKDYNEYHFYKLFISILKLEQFKKLSDFFFTEMLKNIYKDIKHNDYDKRCGGKISTKDIKHIKRTIEILDSGLLENNNTELHVLSRIAQSSCTKYLGDYRIECWRYILLSIIDEGDDFGKYYVRQEACGFYSSFYQDIYNIRLTKKTIKMAEKTITDNDYLDPYIRLSSDDNRAASYSFGKKKLIELAEYFNKQKE